MKNILSIVLAAMLCCLSGTVFADQLSEGFEGETFAPEGWVNIHSSGTAVWSRNTTTTHSSSSASACVNNASAGENYLITPKLVPESGESLTFYVKVKENANNAEFKIQVSTTDQEVSSFTTTLITYNTGSKKTNPLSTSWAQKTISLSSYVGQEIYIAFHAVDAYGSTNIFLDDVAGVTLATEDEGGDCPNPKSLAISNQVFNGATFTWAQNADETTYQWACVAKDADVTSWNNLEANVRTVTVSDLTPGTSYDFYVRTVCENEQSTGVKKNFTPDYVAPSDVTVSGVTSSSATVTWTANSGEAAWTLQYKKTADADWTDVAVATNATHTLAGLDASTAYQVRIVAGDKTSTAQSFKTACGAVELAFEETFSELGCWTIIDGVSGTGVSSNQFAFNYSTAQDQYLISPEFNAIAKPVMIGFDYKARSASYPETFAVGYSTSTSDLASFVWGDEVVASNTTALQYNEVLPANVTYIAVKYFKADSWNLYIDNFSVKEAPSCLAPTGLAASEVMATTATLSWTSEAKKFKVQYTADKENWGEEIEVAAKTLELTKLSPATKYYARVKAVCSDTESSDYCTEIEFTTECEAVKIGWSEDFDAAAVLPVCWETAAWGTGNNQWSIYSYDAHSGSNQLRFKGYGYATTASDLKTPSITLTENDAVLRFYYINGTNAELLMHVGDKDSLLWTFDSKTTYTEKVVELKNLKDETVYFIFRGEQSGSSSAKNLYIDDVEVAYAPVATPTGLAAAAKNASAVITWDAAEGVKWNLQYRAQGDENWKDISDLTENSYTLEGLVNDVTYEVQVQAVVNANRKSAWTQAVTVTPKSCAVVTAVTFGDQTFNSVVVNWTSDPEDATFNLHYKAEGAEDWTELAEAIDAHAYKLTNLAVGTYTVEVKATCDDAWVAAAETVTLSYTKPVASFVSSTDARASFTWSEVADAEGYKVAVVKRGEEAVFGDQVSSKADTTIVDLRTLEEYDFYVAAVYGDHLEVSEKVEFATIIMAPKNMTISNITATSATVAWEFDGEKAIGFQITYGNDPDNLNWSSIGKNLSITVPGLTPNTQYTVYVRAQYIGGVSDSIFATARTLCEKAGLPFEEKFEDGLSACWSADGWAISNSGLNGKGVRMDCGAWPATEKELATPTITLDKEAILAFSYKNAKGGEFKVQLLAAGAEERVTLAEGLVGATNWAKKEIDLSKYSGDVEIFFVGTTNGKDAEILLDEVSVTEKPSCLTPTALTVSNVKFDRATLNWTAAGEETAWQVGYREANTDAVLTIVDVTTTEYVFEGTAGVSYEVYVRAFCDDAHQSEWTEKVIVKPAYQAPTDVEVSDITINSAKVAWTANSGEAAWTVQYRKAGETDWMSVVVENNALATLNGLASGAKYELRVLAGEVASEIASFTTECAAIAELAWSENFNGIEGVPACWEIKGANGDDEPTLVVSDGGYALTLDGNALVFTGKNAQVAYALLPEFGADVLNDAQITFSHVVDAAGKGKVAFGYFVNDEFIAIETLDAATPAAVVNPIVLPAEAVNARLAFRFEVVTDNTYEYLIAVDDIVIEEKPACAVPTGLTVSEITADGAKLAWASEATKVGVQLSTDGEVWADAIVAEENPYVLSSLEPNTLYYVRVQAICSDSEKSDWTEAVSFTTECKVAEMPFEENFEDGVPACWKTEGTWTTNSQFAHSGNALRFDARNHSGSLTTPAIAVTEEDAKLIFYVRNAYGQSNNVSGKVTVNAEGEDPLEAAFINAGADNLNRQVVDLDRFNGKTVTITFSVSSVSSTAYVSIDYVRVIATPCAAPTNLLVEAGDKSAAFSWSASEEEESAWELQYRKVGADEWTSVNLEVSGYEATGLDNDAEYEAQVRSICDDTHQSDWAEFEHFTPSTPTGIDAINSAANAQKLIENDQVVIIRNGVKYNAQGVVVK